MLISVIVSAKDDGTGLLLDHLNHPALLLGKAAVEHMGSKLECRSETSFVDSQELIGGGTKVLDRIRTNNFFVLLFVISSTCAAQLRLVVMVTPNSLVS